MMTKEPKYEYEGRLSFNDRELVICYYLQGYAVNAIAESFGLTPSTIEYHLRKRAVYIPKRKPTMYARVNPIPKRECNPKRTLSFQFIDNEKYWFDEFGQAYRWPKTYKQLLRIQENLEAARRIERERQAQSQEDKPKGFLLRVSLITGACIQRIGEHYHFSSVKQTNISISDSTYAY